jgi:hypothetical protein
VGKLLEVETLRGSGCVQHRGGDFKASIARLNKAVEKILNLLSALISMIL